MQQKAKIDDIKNANLLLIPNENFKEHQGIYFPVTTTEFFEYIKDDVNDDTRVDIACSDEDFQRLELHSAVVNLAQIIVTSVVLPFVINIITSFLYDYIRKHFKSADEMSANLEIIVQEGNVSKKIKYQGPISGIKDTLESSVPELFK